MKSGKEKICFHYLYPYFYFHRRANLKAFLFTLFKAEGIKVEAINYIFCSDDYLFSINKEYLNHYTYTDIVTFPLSEKNQPVISDIFISIDRVKENAGHFSSTFKRELHRVIFHGALHLCGYNDKTKTQKRKMTERENHYLKLYFVSRETKP
jgi:probable rRNA maturation factor